jgi:fructuronate reductase
MFTGRSATEGEQLTAQDGLYTLVTRGPDRDRFELVASLSRAHAAAEHDAWLEYFAVPDLAA